MKCQSARLPISRVPSQARPPCLWTAATDCLRWRDRKDQWHLQGSLDGPRGQGYRHTHFPGETSRLPRSPAQVG